MAHTSASEDGHAAALEEPSGTSDRRKERLSRQERTALVESFVRKCVKITLGIYELNFNFSCISKMVDGIVIVC